MVRWPVALDDASGDVHREQDNPSGTRAGFTFYNGVVGFECPEPYTLTLYGLYRVAGLGEGFRFGFLRLGFKAPGLGFRK